MKEDNIKTLILYCTNNKEITEENEQCLKQK